MAVLFAVANKLLLNKLSCIRKNFKKNTFLQKQRFLQDTLRKKENVFHYMKITYNQITAHQH